MMLVLALRTDAERVYRRARRQFSDEEIAEAFAATRGLTMPSQLRRMLRQQGRDLHGDFLRLLPLPAAPGPHPAVDLAAGRAHRSSSLVGRRLAVVTVAQPAAVPAVTGRPARGAGCGGRAAAARPAASPVALRQRGGRLPRGRRRDADQRRRSCMAQSVPTASCVPCLEGHAAGLGPLRPRRDRAAPPGSGWTPTATGRAPSRCGSTASCDTAGTTQIPSDRDRTAAVGADRPGQPAVRRPRATTCSTAAASPWSSASPATDQRRAAGGRHPGPGRGAARGRCQDRVREETDGRLELDPPRRASDDRRRAPRGSGYRARPPVRCGGGLLGPCSRSRSSAPSSSGSCRSSPASPTSGRRCRT